MALDIEDLFINEEEEPPFVVSNFLYQGQMQILAGLAGIGKSFLSYNMAICVAGNLPFLGYPVTQGSVLYFDEENARPGLRAYVRRIWRGLGEPKIDNFTNTLVIEQMALSKHEHRFKWMAQRAKEVKPILIIIDTASPVCAIQDENHNGEAGRAIDELRKVRDAGGPETAMWILKHARLVPENNQLTIRGAKAWDGALDGTLYHTRPRGQPRKDGLTNSVITPGKIRAFGLSKTITIGAEWTANRGVKLKIKGEKDVE